VNGGAPEARAWRSDVWSFRPGRKVEAERVEAGRRSVTFHRKLRCEHTLTDWLTLALTRPSATPFSSPEPPVYAQHGRCACRAPSITLARVGIRRADDVPGTLSAMRVCRATASHRGGHWPARCRKKNFGPFRPSPWTSQRREALDRQKTASEERSARVTEWWAAASLAAKSRGKAPGPYTPTTLCTQGASMAAGRPWSATSTLSASSSASVAMTSTVLFEALADAFLKGTPVLFGDAVRDEPLLERGDDCRREQCHAWFSSTMSRARPSARLNQSSYWASRGWTSITNPS